MQNFKAWLSRYAWGFFNSLSQLLGWVIQYTDNGNESISAASWRKRDGWFSKYFNRFINFLFSWQSEDHCAEAVWNDVQWCREYLALPGIDHMVLNAQQAAEYRAWQEDRRRVSDIPSSVPVTDDADAQPDVERNDPGDGFVVGESVESDVGTVSDVEAPKVRAAQSEMEPGHKLFDAELWFLSQSESEKKQIVVDGVSVKMPVEQRWQVARIAQVWWNRNAKSVDGHGMDGDGGQQ